MRRASFWLFAASVLVCAGGCARRVVTVNCGSERDFVGPDGAKWLADRERVAGSEWGAVGGMTIVRTGLEMDGMLAPLYLTERYSMEAYEFDVPDGLYLVRLHFAETYERHTAAGQRVFGVRINGEDVLKDLDVLQEAGGFAKPLVKEIDNLKVRGGKIRIDFVAKTQNPEINAIEILEY